MLCETCGEAKPLIYKNKKQCQACYRREKRRERGLRKPGRKPRSGAVILPFCVRGHPQTKHTVRIDGKRVRCKVCYREDAIRRGYDLTPEQYAQMLTDQRNACAICRRPFGQTERDTHVDHCHTTGVVRGLLCPDCNTGLGLFKDDPALLQAALAYVTRES